MEYSLEFNPLVYEDKIAEADGKAVKYRAWENIVYVQSPVDKQHQVMNIYAPLSYFEEGCPPNIPLKAVPIFMPTTVGGYMPGLPEVPGKNHMMQTNASFGALLNGYVVASPGIRGRGIQNEAGAFTGIAPACIVDYKAAVRYLRHNKDAIPGNPEKIISNGTSAGGALSSLLGATGNHPDYEPYLSAIGAANEPDNIFAASCYCPITNLDHADMAYEWMYSGQDNFHCMHFKEGPHGPIMTPIDGELNTEQKTVSEKLKSLFPVYLNGLGLSLVI